MSKRKHEEQELPFVALMDTMTNVVGVLIIVLVMVGLSVASAVKKVLSDLPPVTEEELKEIVEQAKQLPKLPTPKEVEDKQKQAESDPRPRLTSASPIPVLTPKNRSRPAFSSPSKV